MTARAVSVVVVALCAVVALRSSRAETPPKPNILLVLADDLGFGDVGCYNPESKVATPHLDRLAAEGVRFTDAHSPSTVCTPTRYSILTGEMAFRTGYRGVFVGTGGPCLIRDGQPTLPGVLRGAGYTTALFGKWHVGMSFFDRDGERVTAGGVDGVRQVDFSRRVEGGPVDRGFDRFFGTACCPTTDWLYAWIDGDRVPVPPVELLDRSALPDHPWSFDNRRGLVAPDFDLEEVDMVFLEKSLRFLEEHARDRTGRPFFLFHSAQAVHLSSFPGRDFQGKTGAGPHGDFIAEFDHVVGELVAKLDELGLASDTLVVVTSDNGPEVGTVLNMRERHSHDGARPWRGMKRDQWEGGHRVPFIARWSGRVPAGATCDETVCLTDLFATCAALAGAPLPEGAAQDSVDIGPALSGRDNGPLRRFTLHQTISLALAVRRGPWKFLDHTGSGGNNYAKNPRLRAIDLPDTAPGAPGQLYHLGNDPGETTNLYFERPGVVEEMRALLEEAKRSGRSAAAGTPEG